MKPDSVSNRHADIKTSTSAPAPSPEIRAENFMWNELRDLALPILLGDGVITKDGAGYLDCHGQVFVFPDRKGTSMAGATKGALCPGMDSPSKYI
jgi:hypothetical protein